MKHPAMIRNPRLAATVPTLSGGWNASMTPSRVADTALTDVCDMEYRDGWLRTRSGFVTDPTRFSAFAPGSSSRFFVDADGYLLVLGCHDTDGNGELLVSVFDPEGVCTDTSFTITGPLGLNGFFVAAAETVLSERYAALLLLNDGNLYGVDAARGRCDCLTNEAYVPTYSINGIPTKTRAEQTVMGDRAEPFNALTDRFLCTYSADGEGIYYAMPRVAANRTVTVTWERPGDTLTFTITGRATVSDTVGGYAVGCDRVGGCFWFLQNNTPCAVPSNSMYNHITVTSEHAHTETPRLMHMTSGVWFADGRLFLGGQNHVMWSAVGNPLYFPVTAYTAVGNPDEAVTALHMQGEQLVVFKERSLYAVTQRATDALTAQEVMQGETVDVTATAQFAVTPLHATIGCDLPHTVALFGNRLTWACADGTVYTLGTGGTLSQRTVSVISEAVRPVLRETPPTQAAAVVCDERYWLLWNDTILLATDEREPRWTRFSLAATRTQPQTLCVVRGAVVVPCVYTVGTSRGLWYYRQGGQADCAIYHTGTAWHDAVYTLKTVPVKGLCCTKQFDFGDPETYKQVTRVFADVTATDTVQVQYVTERGHSMPWTFRAHDGLRLTPHVTRCRQVALRLCGEGLRVGSVTWHVITGRN